MNFRVHIEAADGERSCETINANSADAAAKIVKARKDGSIVLKVKRDKTPCIIVDGKQTDIPRGSMRHAEIDSTHRMRSDGSYFKV